MMLISLRPIIGMMVMVAVTIVVVMLMLTVSITAQPKRQRHYHISRCPASSVTTPFAAVPVAAADRRHVMIVVMPIIVMMVMTMIGILVGIVVAPTVERWTLSNVFIIV
ncbi:hypothetical protein EDC22_102362 [Tepidamorphus gemmatus]|uniref:Uncharacterized protein n=1 Tax=Tepidamorphus gemmatus TaxID=747076 RepID=A0A4R3MHG9_9HYPH|nr:hypothetical protein [Tepidamorphus gemmatus]TCT12677.1 hypothetical protein EDC22_102362 [Tepidamorphus gemmatus]